jgi:hypothetical protein
MITIRCSALPLAFCCAESVRGKPELRIDPVNAAGSLGTEAHKHLARVARGEHVDLDELEGEVRILVATGARMWRELPGAGLVWVEEQQIAAEFADLGFRLTGSPDAWTTDGSGIHVRDWKSSRLDGDYLEQLMGYGLILSSQDPEGKPVVLSVLWLRDVTVQQWARTADELAAFALRIRDEIVQAPQVYRPGEHCGFCPRWHECPGRLERERALLATFGAASLAASTPSEKLALYPIANEVERLAKQLKEALGAEVKQHGPIVADGKRLGLVDDPSHVIDPVLAWPVLQEAGFKDADFGEVVKISKTALEAWASAHSPKGKAAGKSRDLRTALTVAGAWTIRLGQKLRFGKDHEEKKELKE